MSVTVSLLWVCDSSPSSFSDSESCRDSLVLLRLPARRMEDREPPFLTRKLRAPLIWSSREPPIRILRMGAGEDGSGETSSALFIKISTQGNDKPISFVWHDTWSHLELPASSCHHRWCQTSAYGCCCWANRARLHHRGCPQSWSSSHSDDGRAPGPDADGSCPDPTGHTCAGIYSKGSSIACFWFIFSVHILFSRSIAILQVIIDPMNAYFLMWLTTRGSVRGRGKQGKVSRRKVVISNNSWQAAIFRAKGQPHFVGLTVSLGWIKNKAGWLKHWNV